jgi:phosphoribosyl-ATP pyrophosphohydrolase/phosphoribosyl-AMP cyclohydrolase
MIIPSVDIQNGQAVQLVGGKEKKIDAGDPMAKLQEFSLAGEVAVIDLDAAMRKGSNKAVIEKMVQAAPCRVGGGIRDVETAIDWLDRGAAKIILGTKAEPEILKHLPKERVIAALDAENGEIVVEGWQEKTGRKVIDRMHELRDYVGGFLVTFVELEGRMKGTNLEAVKELKNAAGNCELTIAGGVTTAKEIYELDQLGADAQVGMAIYSGNLGLAECIASPVGLAEFPCIIQDEFGQTICFIYSNLKSIEATLKSKKVIDLNGDLSAKLGTHELIRITPDFDRKCFFFNVRTTAKPFAFNGLRALDKIINERKNNSPVGSYTERLFKDQSLLSNKLIEEANELIQAKNAKEANFETADLFYFALTALHAKGGNLLEVEKELNRRALKVTRRPGNSK